MSMLRAYRRALCLAACVWLVALLGGCAGLPASPEILPERDALADFFLEGRFSLRHDEKNYSGRLTWRHHGLSNEVLLSSPFGQGLAEIVADERGARLTMGDGRVFEANDVETLTQDVLGYPLPLALLTDWVRGRPGAGEVERDAFGRLLRLRHQDWNIDYGYEGDDAQAPPSRIFALRAGGSDLRLRIDAWRSLLKGEDVP